MKKGKLFFLSALSLSLGLACGTAELSGISSAAATETEEITEESSQKNPEKTTEKSADEPSEKDAEALSESSLLASAASLTADVLAGNYERVKTEYSYEPLMQLAVNSGQIEQALVPSLAASGDLQEQKAAFVSARQGGYVNVDVPCLFTRQSWNLSVSFSQSGQIAGLHISEYRERLPVPPEGISETELALPIGEGRQLPGTLTMPEGVAFCPAVIFVHGSGVNDRDEAAGSIRPFQDLAWSLAQQGIASYRYDKINYVYGAEAAADPDFTLYDETINDAAAAVELLRSQPGITSVYVVGHSQGAMTMGSIVQLGKPDGCVLMAAPARSFTETLERQIDFLKERSAPLTGEEQQTFEWYEEQIALMKDLDSLPEGSTVLGQNLTYIRSLVEYDPCKEARQITVPALVLQGEEDYQVTMEDYSLWQEQFEGQENWSFQSFPGLTHLFTEGSYEDGPDSYVGEKHVALEVTAAIAAFVLQQ